MPGTETGGQKAREAQIVKYGGPEGYAQEMRRRANMRKVHSGGTGTTEEYRRRAKLAWRKRKNAQDKDRQSGQVFQPLDKE